MEFVIVSFPRMRPVMIDGAPQGQTNVRQRVQAGTHTFDLDVPDDYTPPTQTLPVVGTTPEHPLEVIFMEKPIPAAAPRRRAAKKAVRRAAKRKKTTTRKRKPAARRRKKKAAKR